MSLTWAVKALNSAFNTRFIVPRSMLFRPRFMGLNLKVMMSCVTNNPAMVTSGSKLRPSLVSWKSLRSGLFTIIQTTLLPLSKQALSALTSFNLGLTNMVLEEEATLVEETINLSKLNPDLSKEGFLSCKILSILSLENFFFTLI